MNILVIATHFDDEVLGCGGTILKHVSNGDNVYVCFICGGTSVRFPDKELVNTRREHAKKAAELLGVKEIIINDFPIIMLDTIPQLDIVTAIENAVFNIKPDIIYMHYGDDMNSDHRVVFNAATVWCRPSKTPFLKRIYMYETFCSSKNFIPNYYVDISQNIQKKLDALSLYTTENKVATRTVETIKKVSAYRGAEINTNYAEAFVVFREIF